MFKLTGTIKVIGDTIQVSEKFSKRDLVITDNSTMYPQDIQFQLQQKNCELLDGKSVGQKVDVSFNLRGREWTSPQGEVKYFNTLEAWKIDVVGHQSNAPIAPPTQASNTQTTEADDDLPF